MKRTIFTVITLLWATIALADVTVNFTVPLNLQKMDPSLKHAAAKCFIKGADGKEIAFGYAHSTAPVSGNAVNGNAVVPVSLSFAQASSAKLWECTVAPASDTAEDRSPCPRSRPMVPERALVLTLLAERSVRRALHEDHHACPLRGRDHA